MQSEVNPVTDYLVVLTKKFGIEYTGATVATQNLIKYWKDVFKKIIVITLECGTYEKDGRIEVRKVRNNKEITSELRKVAARQGSKSFYSDDHLGYLFHDIGAKYVHTYHGNWPDAKYTDLSFFMKSFYFIPCYAKTIRCANTVVNVSHYMEKFTDKYNKNSVVIHNGIQQRRGVIGTPSKDFLMVGNIDKRKYGYLIKLLQEPSLKNAKFVIDIYGKAIDQNIANELGKDSRVHFMGQQKSIDYQPYKAMLNVSSMENLSISVCEAILSGTPVLSFAIGGLPEVVINGKTGWVFKAFDTKAMARRMLKVLEEDKMPVDSELLADFDWKIAAEKYMKIFGLL